MKRGWPCISAPDVLGVKTVDVLLGGNGLEHRVDVEVLRQRQLHQNAVDAWIGIELGDFREYHARFDIRRVGQLLGVETGLHTGIDLVAHIDLRSGVFADQDHRQSGAVAARRQRFGALLEVGAQRLRQRVAVEDSCRHFAFPWGGRKRKGAMPRFGAPSELRMDQAWIDQGRDSSANRRVSAAALAAGLATTRPRLLMRAPSGLRQDQRPPVPARRVSEAPGTTGVR
jgi:hypothetical protein